MSQRFPIPGMQRLTILCYHAVVPAPLPVSDWCFLDEARFLRQMTWLARSPFRVASLSEATSDLVAGRLRRPTVALTFDDGFRNNMSCALPILQRFDFPATIFLTTGFIGSRKTTWPCRILEALEKTAVDGISWGGERIVLRTLEDRVRANRELQALVKENAAAMPNEAAGEIERCLEVPVDPDVDRESPFAMVDVEDLHLGVNSGLLEFGAHTVSHPILSALEDVALKNEIEGSLEAVSSLIPEPSSCFAYPNGRHVDFDARTISKLAENGVRFSVTTVPTSNERSSDPFRLGRLGIGCDTTMIEFSAMLAGAWLFPGMQNLLRGIRR